MDSTISPRAPGRNRTCDSRFRKPLLYPLSYEGRGQSSSGNAAAWRPEALGAPICRHTPPGTAPMAGRHLRHARHDVAVGVHDRNRAVVPRPADDLGCTPHSTAAWLEEGASRGAGRRQA
jgi:hypothetical protein